MFEIFIMNLNDELINNILIDSDYEFLDEIDDSNLDPDFTIGNNDHDSDITHISESKSESNDYTIDLQHDTLILPGRKPGRPRKDVPMTTDLQRIWRKDDDVLNNYTYNLSCFNDTHCCALK